MRIRRLRTPVVVRLARFCGYGGHRRRVNPAALVLFLLLLGPQPVRAAEPVELLVFGDSLVAGYGLPQADGFVAQLQRALDAEGLNVKVINAGVSGDTTAGGRARLAWTLGQGEAQPDAAIVELGANDALRGLDPAQAEVNLDAILAELQRRGIPTLLAGMLAPPNLGTEYKRRFDAVYPALAKTYGVALYPFFLDGVAGQRTLNQPDGLHPNTAGVAEIVRRITPDVVALVRAAGARPAAR
jgi:Lysophospholipase L1 and related esterases